MARPYSNDLRTRVVAAVKTEGLSRHQAASRYGVAISTAINWVKRFEDRGGVSPDRIGGHKPNKIAGDHAEWLRRRCREKTFKLRGLVKELADGRGLIVDYRSVWEFVHAEGLSYKKTLVASERDRPDVARRREQWMKYQGRLDPARLVFIDETWAKTNMAPLRGWAPRGDRLEGKAPHGHWKTATFIAALRSDRVEAPWLLDGPINGQSFLL